MAIRKAPRLAIEMKRARMTWCGVWRLFISSSSETSVLTNSRNRRLERFVNPSAGRSSWEVAECPGSLTLQQASQPPVTGATDRQPRAVIQDGDMAVLGIGFEFHNSLEVHKIRAMNAQEVLRIERAFQAGYGLLLQIFFPLAGQRDVVVLGFGIIQFADGNDLHARAIPHNDAFGVMSGLARRRGKIGGRGKGLLSQALLGPIERGLKPLRRERLQQIIHGVDFEGPQRMLVVSGYKYHGHGVGVAEQFQHFKAVELRHLHVEEEQVGLQLRHHLHSVKAVATFADDLHLGMRLQHLAQNLPRQVLVLDNEGADLFLGFHGHAGAGIRSAGNSMATRNRSPSTQEAKVARSPYRVSSRWRTFRSPVPLRGRGGISGSKLFST